MKRSDQSQSQSRYHSVTEAAGRVIYLCNSINPDSQTRGSFFFFSPEQSWGHQSSDLLELFETSRPRSSPLERRVFILKVFAVHALVLLGPELPPYYGPILDWPIWRLFAPPRAERPMTDVQSGLEGGFVRFWAGRTYISLHYWSVFR